MKLEQARLTWWFRADNLTGSLPDNADVWIAGATFKHVVEAVPDRVTFEETSDVRTPANSLKYQPEKHW